MDWEFKILDAIQKYFSGNFMDNIMSKNIIFGKCRFNLDNTYHNFTIV